MFKVHLQALVHRGLPTAGCVSVNLKADWMHALVRTNKVTTDDNQEVYRSATHFVITHVLCVTASDDV